MSVFYQSKIVTNWTSRAHTWGLFFIAELAALVQRLSFLLYIERKTYDEIASIRICLEGYITYIPRDAVEFHRETNVNITSLIIHVNF